MSESFSVLISVYFRSPLNHFKECLTSLSSQSLLPSEIVIVQDGILEYDIFEILNSYDKLNFKVIKNNKNLGLPKSLNKGLEHCSNDIIFRMDADDICETNRFKYQLEKFIINDKLILLGTNVELIDSESKVFNRNREIPITNNEIRKVIIFKNPFNHPSVVFRKHYVQKVGGYSDLYLYEDWFLWFKLAQLPDVEFENLPQKLLKYRIRTFNDRHGFKIIKAEYKFYSRLLKAGYINKFQFLINICLKSVVRVLPIFLYNFFKYIFDKLK
jgi:glycosyltransferase involved in cell wall biosynthesis